MIKLLAGSFIFLLCITAMACKKNTIASGGGEVEPPPPPPPPVTNNFASAAVINQRLGKGINMGNHLESIWDPAKDIDVTDFKKIADLGFTSVRLPVNWDLPERSQTTAPYTIKPEFLARVKKAVDAALKNKLHVIINMHHHNNLFSAPDAHKPMFISQWQQIANHFKDYPDSLLFEVLNEPNSNLDAAKWNIFFADALAEIRKTNPKRTVFLGLAEWGGVSAIQKLKVPKDEHLILTIHYYNPFEFTHQTADWVSGSDAWAGTKWHDTEFERQDVMSDFKEAIKFAKENNLPVNVGEFGAYDAADMASRVRWSRFMARWFEEQKFSWHYWEFNAGFGIYNPVSGQYRTGLVNALLKDDMKSPTAVTTTDLYSSNFSGGQRDGWNIFNNDASASSSLSIANNRATVNISSPGKESWHIQLTRSQTAIEAGKTYRVTFNAYSSTTKNISCQLMRGSDPWTGYGSREFVITASDATYGFTFTSPITDANCNFVFSMGNSGNTPVTIYNIKLQQVEL